MSTREIAAVLVLLLSNVPTAAASQAAHAGPVTATASTAGAETPTPVADAGARASPAAREAPVRRGVSPMWHVATAGLLIGGTATILYGARARDGCYDYREYDTCGDFRRKYYAVGGALLGTGGTLIVLGGNRTSRRRTSIDLNVGRLTLRHRVGF